VSGTPLHRAVGYAAALLLVVGLAVVGGLRPSSEETAATGATCSPGYKPVDLEELRREFRFGAEESEEEEGEGESSEEGEGAIQACLSVKHPEPFMELEALGAQRAAMLFAPFTSPPPGAYGAAVRQAQRISATVPGSEGRWTRYGRGPLISNDERYDQVNGLGLVELNGRVDSLDFDRRSRRLFASIGTGGVWMSEDWGRSWRSIGNRLPTQVIGAIAWTPAGGGTIVAGSGEPLMGGNTYTGIGAFWTNDLGRTWHRSEGVPEGGMTFQVAVDPTHRREVYLATSKGLFRSTDAGRTFRNVRLPTGECAGKTGNGRCIFANFVTDVVVQAPDRFENKGGTVLAAVGYRAGDRPFPQDPDTAEAPWTGLYRSRSGLPGKFKKLEASGFAPQNRIGRVELGPAVGRRQDHDYVYAIVEDAVLFQGGTPTIDVPEDLQPGVSNTSFNGIYVSRNFGRTWTQMADTAEVSENPNTGSSLVGAGQALFFAPGVQAWYNEWIKPDPTRQTAEGVPTRVSFGLEEVWQNRDTDAPQDGQPPNNGPDDFHVIGRYFAGENCLLLINGVPVCPGSDPVIPETTTHPDQHDALYARGRNGSVRLVVGNDGGVYVQRVRRGQEFTNDRWGIGRNRGFNTLLPYFATMAKDGTVWHGLQDNGTAKIDPAEGRKQYMTLGGDGFFTAVDPDNSDVAYAENPGAFMWVTEDGGQSWQCMPPPISGAQFSNPFVMDPTDANHLLTAGHQVVETVDGPDTAPAQDPGCNVTGESTWTEVFDLGANAETGEDNQMSAVDLHGDNAYVGFCGGCDIINGLEFGNGLATNVAGPEPPQRGTPNGWHFAAAEGLPNRYITSIAIDPDDPETIYVTLGGYANRQWRPPGSYGDVNEDIGEGHVFKSTDAGETFVDISANLPDAPTFWVELVGDQLVIGTQVGAFLSNGTNGGRWAALDAGLPVVPVVSVMPTPQDPNVLVAATYGRGVYTYRLS
jgi:hypothetical protein